MRRRSCRGAGSTTAALALKLLFALDRSRQIQRALHWTDLAILLQHRVALHRRTFETFRAPHHAAESGAALMAAKPVTAKPTESAEHRKATLLTLIKTVVERPRGLAQLLERVAGFHHRGGAAIQPLGRIGVNRSLRVGGTHAVDPQLGEIARSLLERWPSLLLLSRQREPSLERGKTRFAERPHILNARAPVAQALTARTILILRIHNRAACNEKCGRTSCDRFPH